VPATPASAAWQAPSCDALAQFAAAHFPPKKKGRKPPRWKLSSTARDLWLPAVMKEDGTAALFGAPVLEWTATDAQKGMKQAKTCARKMKKAKRGRDAQRLGWLSAAFKQKIGHVLRKIEKAEKQLDGSLAALLAAPASRDALRATAALSRVKPGGKLDPADWRVLKTGTPPYSDGNNALSALRNLPDWRSDEVRPRVQARYDALRQPVVDELGKEIMAAPATLDGLNGLPATLAATRKDLGGALTEADYAALDAAAATRREAIEAELVKVEIARLAAVPDGLPGLAAVQAVIAGPVVAAVSEPRKLEIRKAGIERRRGLADAVIAAELAGFDGLPQSYDGLRRFGQAEAAALGRLRGHDLGGGMTEFEHGVRTRKTALGRAAFDDFKTQLAALPEDVAGRKQLGGLDAESRRLLEGARRSVREAYQSAVAERRASIEAAVAREEARLARLPLEGAVFADRHGNKFEFRDGDRVYITFGGQVTHEAKYEEDGARVVLRTPQANMVMTRDGAWLKGNSFKLRRRAGN